MLWIIEHSGSKNIKEKDFLVSDYNLISYSLSIIGYLGKDDFKTLIQTILKVVKESTYFSTHSSTLDFVIIFFYICVTKLSLWLTLTTRLLQYKFASQKYDRLQFENLKRTYKDLKMHFFLKNVLNLKMITLYNINKNSTKRMFHS